jgi:hypothetical protein
MTKDHKPKSARHADAVNARWANPEAHHEMSKRMRALWARIKAAEPKDDPPVKPLTSG